MNRHVKKKLWLDYQSKKKAKKRRKKTRSITVSNNTLIKEDPLIGYYRAVAPKCFSFVNNTEDTIIFFFNIINQFLNKKSQNFYIDSSYVDYVTTDALVYILAILYNLKSDSTTKYKFCGNLPTNAEAKKVYLESGFMNYVVSKKKKLPKPSNKVQILYGNKTEPDIARQICDFVNLRLEKDYIFTIDLYKTLIELMSNTVHHAYDNSSITQPYWYVYAIDTGKTIKFAFIDTGFGIPNTVKRKFYEKLPFTIKDSELIYSAFLGESRTETRLYNRGHGLPALYKLIKCHQLQNFYVLSGKGCCKYITKNGKIDVSKDDWSYEIFGTIFQFEISANKEVIAC